MARRQRSQLEEASEASPLSIPASKRLKSTHVPTSSGLDFLVDEDKRQGRKLHAKLTNGVSSHGASRVDESRAVVAANVKGDDEEESPIGSSAENAIGITSSDEESDAEDESEIETAADDGTLRSSGLTNGHAQTEDEESAEDVVTGAEDADMIDRDPTPELSFGEMLQARYPDPINVQASDADRSAKTQALIPTSADRTLTAPTGTSLSTVLTQALRTNDKDLLETCFSTKDLPSIRSTIQRLPSQHVSTLIQRLAERIHRRPGRTGSLLVWVQWSLIAHGGFLAAQPDVMRKMRALELVLRERAKGLQPLLHLKGKLDLLSAQLEMRRSSQRESWARNAGDEEDMPDDGVIYVEGQEEDELDSEEEEEDTEADRAAVGQILEAPRLGKHKVQLPTPNTELSDSEDSSDGDDDLPNGVIQEGDDGSSADDEEEEGMFDIEAEETSEDEGDDIEDDSEEDGESDDESASDGGEEESDASSVVPAPLPKTLNRKR